jgi:hypothetical protein
LLFDGAALEILQVHGAVNHDGAVAIAPQTETPLTGNDQATQSWWTFRGDMRLSLASRVLAQQSSSACGHAPVVVPDR